MKNMGMKMFNNFIIFIMTILMVMDRVAPESKNNSVLFPSLTYTESINERNIVMPKFNPSIGQRFGRLVVLGLSDYKRYRILCKCDCGNIVPIYKYNLRDGISKSCGCLRNEIVTKHGHNTDKKGKSPTYSSWDGIIQRCNNPNCKAYKHYGGRGITVCERWNKFENFLADMGENPSKGYSIDRIDVNGNYEPSNCRWATAKEQSRNKRATVINDEIARLIKKILETKELTQQEIADLFKIKKHIVSDISVRREWT